MTQKPCIPSFTANNSAQRKRWKKYQKSVRGEIRRRNLLEKISKMIPWKEYQLATGESS